MDFDQIDGYLLDGIPQKGLLIGALLAWSDPPEAAKPFLEGMHLLRARTPDLAVMALRLVVAGQPHDDAAVVGLRSLVERARTGDTAARAAYFAQLERGDDDRR